MVTKANSEGVRAGAAPERQDGAKDGKQALTTNGSEPLADRIEDIDGLVICDITGLSQIFAPKFPSHRGLAERADEMAKVARTSKKITSSYIYEFQLSPGAVRIARTYLNPRPKSDNYKAKTIITEWSEKSRAKMVWRLATLDYNAMMKDVFKPPAMITLTYPKYWEELAPNSQAAKRHLNVLKKRYAKAFGENMVGLWKMEFQRRGAVHFHLLLVPPNTPKFAQWLSTNWTEIVAPKDPEDRANHLLAGTGIDYEEGIRAFDPRRIAVYFSKHSSANFGEKEYQNRPPRLWVEAGNVGRFWGYWGLKPDVTSVVVGEADALFIARTLRRWARAKGETRREEVWRVDTKTGEFYKRHSRKRIKYLTGRLGFLTVNDGEEIAHFLTRALERCR